MSRSTDSLRSLWRPPCTGVNARVVLHGGAKVTVRPAILDAVKALNACLAKHNYPATPPDCGAYNCRPITGGTKYSLHAYGIAIDINWQRNPYGRKLRTDMPSGMIADIKRIRTRNGVRVWGWGGDYSGNKDAMHFEVIASPSEIATGIDPRTVPGGVVYPPKPPVQPEEKDMTTKLVQVKESGTKWAINGVERRPVTEDDARLLAILGIAVYDKGGKWFVWPRSSVELVPQQKP